MSEKSLNLFDDVLEDDHEIFTCLPTTPQEIEDIEDIVKDDLIITPPNKPPPNPDPELSIEIVEQPAEFFECSFPVNLKSKKNALVGHNSKKYQKHPIILHYRQPSSQGGTLKVLCLLCPESESTLTHRFDVKAGIFPQQSAYLLINNVSEQEAQESQLCKPIVIEMEEPRGENDDSSRGEIELENLHIMRPCHAENAIKRKHLELAKWHTGKELSDNELQEIEKKALKDMPQMEKYQKFTLCLIPFLENPQGQRHFGPPTYTQGFREYFRISKIHPKTSKFRGGELITLTLKEPLEMTHTNIQVHLYEEINATLWEAYPDCKLSTDKKEITFTAPAYGNDNNNNNVTKLVDCSVEIFYQNEELHSRPIRFMYTNGEIAPIQRKRRIYVDSIHRDYVDSIHPRNSLDVFDATEQSERNLWTLVKEILASDDDVEEQQSLIEDIYNNLPNPKPTSHASNLLHHACGNREYAPYIPRLVRLRGLLCAQDRLARTPLHVAIAEWQDDCIVAFTDIYANYRDYTDILDDLKRLLGIYDADGYTVLHWAALSGLDALVESMLKFCIENALNVWAIEALGGGDTILHLAVRNGNEQVEAVILKHIPDAIDLENYAGEKAYAYAQAGGDDDLKQFGDLKI